MILESSAVPDDFSVAFMSMLLHDTEFIKPPIEAESDSRYVWKLRKALNDLLSTTVDDRRGRAPRDSSRSPQRPSPKRCAFLTSSQGKRWKVFGT